MVQQRDRRDIWAREALWGTIAALLAAPRIAMWFTPEVRWTTADFVFAGLLLVGLGATLELIVRSPLGFRSGIVLGLAAIAAVMIAWAEGAVGIF